MFKHYQLLLQHQLSWHEQHNFVHKHNQLVISASTLVTPSETEIAKACAVVDTNVDHRIDTKASFLFLSKAKLFCNEISMIVLQSHLGTNNMVIPSEVSTVENKNLPGLFHGGDNDGVSGDFYFDPDDMPYCT